ncbi:MAG: enoyl-CoA hydratase-related protein [Bacteroidales bacterium]
MQYQILNIEKKNKTGILTINRPEALNALNKRFLTELDWFLSLAAKDKTMNSLIITGAGKAFVAGADITEMAGMDEKEAIEFATTGQKIFRMLEKLSVPVIAAVNGFALGGGCELAMACDIRIASEKAKFGQPEVNLGLIPGFGGTQRLSRLIGIGHALNLLCTGNMIDAHEALKIGLVQKVCEESELMNEAINLSETINLKGKNAVRMVKKTARMGLEMTFEEACWLEAANFGSLFGKPEMQEGTKAFIEKRKPLWPES